MRNIWYTHTGLIDAKSVADLIVWVNNQTQANSDDTRLTLFLSSTGGDIDSAVRAYSFLKGLPIDLEIIGFGQIDSAANTIFLASKTRKALKGCRFFLHEGTFSIGNPSAALHVHEETLRLLQNLLQKTIDIITSETGKNREEIIKILRDGQIFTAAEAVEFGLATEIIEKIPKGLGSSVS